MSETACGHCGATMPPEGACPVCELSPGGGPAAIPMEPSAIERWWRGGQLLVAASASLLLSSLFLPLLREVPIVTNRELDPHGALTPLDLALGVYAPLRGTLTAWMLPGAALFLFSLLRTRRTASAMRATRPVVAVVSLAPVLTAALPMLKLARRGVSASLGPAVALIAAAVVLGLAGALRFGEGVEDGGSPADLG